MADEDKIQFQNLKNQKMVKPEKKVAMAPVKHVEKSQKGNLLTSSPKLGQTKEEKAEVEQEKEDKIDETKTETPEEKKEEVKTEEKKPEKKKAVSIVKKEESKVYARVLPISLKYSKGIGKFIKGKKIAEAIQDLGRVELKKKAVPMPGELPHRKGKGIMSGKYPVKAAGYFIKLLKTLNANSIANGMELEDTKIVEVIVNKGPGRMHRGGRTQFKQTHVLIRAKEVQKHINSSPKLGQTKEIKAPVKAKEEKK